ncbi:MHO_1580 family protein [Mycoplasmopsis verecunda]|uniref:Uncharacterized protein n=1 Tax=Mycoplasmopsis verecunda TaxID=171291 RepID=A0A1T4KTP1_9BACT|nr:hypothetical protein [Mycoplasmopsis verecunda]WPB54654.1 hypothetical protein SAM46_00625 [Mycoplasmopsis verecunda]SJZ45799.1 hypothetical protein SAMN02745154_00179 [Mycoplasmopsis verecunda]
MINVDFINQNDNYIVNERKVKVNTLANSNDFNNFKAKFAINVDRIATNGMTDISVGFEDGLYDWKNKDLLPHEHILDTGINLFNGYNLIVNKLAQKKLAVEVSIFANLKEIYTFRADKLFVKKYITRIPFSTLGIEFSKLNSLIIQFSLPKGVFTDERKLIKEYQIIFAPDSKDKIQIAPISNSIKLRIPYSYQFNFESSKTYWKELLYHNVIIKIADINNRKPLSQVVEGYEYNDKKKLKFPNEILFNEYIPLTFNNIILNDFLTDKISLKTIMNDNNNQLLSNNNSGIYFKGLINELLLTDEIDKKIRKVASPQSSYSLKIPFSFDGEFNTIYSISSKYFDIDIIKKFKSIGTRLFEDNYTKKLKIIVVSNQKNLNNKYRYVINLKSDYVNLFTNSFNINDYLIIEDENKRKYKN